MHPNAPCPHPPQAGLRPHTRAQAFDELLLLKRGGRTIYNGPLGHLCADLIAFFESVDGVPRIQRGYNPATWMLEVSSLGSEQRLGVDFADIYDASGLRK